MKKSTNLKWTPQLSVFLSAAIVKLLFVIFAAATVYSPFGIESYAARTGGCNKLMLAVSFYLCAAFAFTALVTLDKLLKNIRLENIFITSNVTYLRILSWCCYGVGVVTAIYSIWEYYFMVIAAAAAFFGLVLRVLKNVFCKAVEIREENDATI